MLRTWRVFALLGATVTSGALVGRPVTFWGRPPLAQAPPVWDYDMNASGYPIERSACLTIRVGDEAAAECGDLRVTHELPAVRIYNSRLAPTLVYNSEHAHPRVSTPLLITLASTTTRPDFVEVEVLAGAGLDPKTSRATQRWAGSEWGASGTVTRRVTVAYDAITDTTGIYLLQFRVTNIYPGPVRMQSPDIAGGSRIVINRSTSPYGAGWWLAGHEQVKKTLNNGEQQYLWIGGDGSARQFGFSYTIGYDRADSLRYDPATQIFTRRLPEGRRVEFDALGQHLRTVNRFGRVTQYTYGSFNKLASIALPAPTGLSYNFTYTSGRVSSITAPPIGATSRIVTLTNASGVLTDIQNPGDVAVHYDYHAGPANVLYRRVNRRGVPTTFVFDSALKVRSSTVDPGAGASAIVWTIKAGESRGLANSEVAPTASSVDTAQSATRIDGPRTDVADTTLIFQGRFGGARRIVDALGAQTIIRPRFLAAQSLSEPDNGWLVWRVDLPAGTFAAPATRIQRFQYEIPRGNLVVVKDSSASGSPAADSTIYQWDQSFDQLKKVTPMLLNTTEFGINASNGRREWQQDARGTSARISFLYADTNYPEQVTSVVYPASTPLPAATYAFTYGTSLRNTETETSPKNFVTSYTVDPIGRVTMAQSPIDSLTTSTRKAQRRLGYSLRDEVLADTSMTVNVSPAETLVVRTFYDGEEMPDSVRRNLSPNPATLGAMRLAWIRDGAGRVVKAIAPDDKYDSTVYDAAGNVRKSLNRRFVATTVDSTQYVAATYDALNRVVTRTIPSVEYPTRVQGIATLLGQPPYPALQVPRDDQTFAYTRDGQLQWARNKYGHVGRVYSVRGELTTDSALVSNVAGTSFVHTYVTQFRYDRNGRRIVARPPSQLVVAGKDSIRYTYASWGALDHVYDPYSNDIAYSYNARGEVEQIGYPLAGVTRRIGYDVDGRLVGDTITNNSTTFPRFTFPQLRAARRYFDGRDKLLKSTDLVAYPDEQSASYSGLGYLQSSAYRQVGAASWPAGAFYSASQSFTTDALGDIVGQVSLDSISLSGQGNSVVTSATMTRNYRPTTGRDSVATTTSWTRTQAFDGAGNSVFASLTPAFAGNVRYQDRASYYNAAGQLVFADARENDGKLPLGTRWWTRTQESYRYDALGRRIWLRAVQDCNQNIVYDAPPQFIDAPSVRCANDYIRRTIWDGEREFLEIQAPGDTTSADSPHWETDVGAFNRPKLSATSNDPNPYYGRVLYTHGPALDEPLTITRYDYADNPYQGTWTTWSPFVILPFWNAAGGAMEGVYSDGAAVRQLTPSAGPTCASGNSANRCVALTWPRSWTAYDPRLSLAMASWQGTLLEEKRDYAGTHYRRNRAYDPATGRFTQEDPIGLAGGLNLYGYASGDPVNFGDPFGLCPKAVGGDGKTKWLTDCPDGSAGRAEWNRRASGRAEAVDDPLFLIFGGIELRGASRGITIGKEAFKHVLERHAFWSTAKNASKFNAGVQIGGLIRAAEKVSPTAARRGALQWVVDAGREIGTDRITGRATSFYTVITDRLGNLVTAHPGVP